MLQLKFTVLIIFFYDLNEQIVIKFNVCITTGVGVEGERVGEGERDAAGEVHGGAEQTVGRGRRRPLHPHHQQRDGVRFPVHLQLHGLERIRAWHHDHHTGGDW